ncbi:RHS repeat-associated core domain-containing protein [Pseudomonas putida]
MKQRNRNRANSRTLLAVDQQGSIGNASGPIAYLPFGYRTAESGLRSALGFNGELQESMTGNYSLGTGYQRVFNPILMRFHQPDSWCPFGEGGLNPYSYVLGDPVNSTDPTGHMPKRQMRLSSSSSSGSMRVNASSSGKGSISSMSPQTSGPGSSNSPLSSTPSRGKLSSSISLGSDSVFTEPQQPWTLIKKGAEFKSSGLTDAEQRSFDTFQNAIHNFNLSPQNAASLVGGADFKVINKKLDIFQIRLSGSERVLFTIKDKVVQIREVGGHL